MSTARVPLIARIYAAVVEEKDLEATASYQTWVQTALPVRGPLERKRVASRDAITRVLGPTVAAADVSMFSFAVEAYLSFRAYLLVHLAASRLMEHELSATLDVDEILSGTLAEKAGLTGWSANPEASWLTKCIASVGPHVLAAELITAQEGVENFFIGPFTDLLGADHQTLIPKQLRHATGAFYTPQWLARFALQAAGYMDAQGGPEAQRIIDPTCGSGVFLIAAAEELRRRADTGHMKYSTAMEVVLSNFVGIDIDPLASVQAKANIALAAMALAASAGLHVVHGAPQIYCQDSLLPPVVPLTADFLVGNPPWVNWEYLPPEYRIKHADLWRQLGIFDLQGKELAWSKEDVSALILANSIDQYLRDGGRVAFVVPQSLVKASLNYRGLRSFRIRGGQFDEVPYRVERVEDFVAVKPFEGVSNRTILMIGTRGTTTEYPLPYQRWIDVEQSSKQPSYRETIKGQSIQEWAEPSDPQDPASHWTTGLPAALEALRSLSGASAYRARTGVFTGGANGVFHVETLKTSRQTALVRNITERAKRKVAQVEAQVETTFLYPFLRGRDVSQWSYQAQVAILLPHTAASRMSPVSEEELARTAPATLEYFDQFRVALAERRGFSAWERKYLETGFYACQRVGEYTFSPWKVVWRYIAPSFMTAVIGPSDPKGPFGGKPHIPNEKLMSVACCSAEEAYFVGALFASSPVRAFVESRMVSTQIAPHLIRRLRLPNFDPLNDLHMSASNLCREGHEITKSRNVVSPSHMASIDALVARILGIEEVAAEMLRAALDGASIEVS